MASKRHKRRRPCTTKRGHEKLDSAWYAARRLNVSDPFGQKWRPYRCQFCGLWHVGRW